jgi:HSP20 family protein
MLPLLFDEITRFPVFFDRETEKTTFTPALDVFEHADRYELKLDLPGVEKSDVKVSFEHGVLSIDGTRKAPSLPEGAKGRFERWNGAFATTLNLPEDANAATLEAQLREGVLTLSVKKAEAAKPRQISIQ